MDSKNKKIKNRACESAFVVVHEIHIPEGPLYRTRHYEGGQDRGTGVCVETTGGAVGPG
jgi:hypothetical protein